MEHENFLTGRIIEDYFRFLLARDEKVNLLFVLLTDFGSITQKKVIHFSIFQIQLILEYWSISIWDFRLRIAELLLFATIDQNHQF